MKTYRIAVCDDDEDIVRALKIYLTAEGYEVLTASNGMEALELVLQGNVQLLIMDVMMPKLDGIETMTRLREKSNIPVILLTARSEDSDKVLGLNVGADDYVTKPFSPVELLARVKSQLRRYTGLGGIRREEKEIFRIDGVCLDDVSKTVTVDGEAVALTPIEYKILKLLIQNPNRVYSSSQLYRKVWNEEPLGNDGAVAVHIRHLREKIEIDPSEPRYIKVVWGLGYKFAKGE
ncbi:MAG: response regulator transcription factor [Clostridia bacterium]|nr:response regulator transcription factor [Clostridia bacterium]